MISLQVMQQFESKMTENKSSRKTCRHPVYSLVWFIKSYFAHIHALSKIMTGSLTARVISEKLSCPITAAPCKDLHFDRYYREIYMNEFLLTSYN